MSLLLQVRHVRILVVDHLTHSTPHRRCACSGSLEASSPPRRLGFPLMRLVLAVAFRDVGNAVELVTLTLQFLAASLHLAALAFLVGEEFAREGPVWVLHFLHGYCFPCGGISWGPASHLLTTA